MQGFDHQTAGADFGAQDKLDVVDMADIGKRGTMENLPVSLQKKDYLNSKKPSRKIVMGRHFTGIGEFL